MIMRKATFRLMLLALPMMLGLASCVDNFDNSVINNGDGRSEAQGDNR